ncbi:MAG: glycosyltransferase family 2 protein [Bryobacteraceae bacterium]|nr:glycosyltransferase family 2 protein [Bryobacteraceae bacterium]
MREQGFPGGPGFVTVVVVNWNRRPLLEACLASLARPQGVLFEVIVVDNGSTDGSPEWIASTSFPFPLRLIRNASNLGFCAANNQGIDAARGEFVALLNNDAEADPFWLAHLVSAFDDPRVGMAASKILVWEAPEIIDKAGHLIWLDGQNRGRGHGQRDHGQFDLREEVLWPDGCACMLRRSMLLETGGFDEDFFAYADDAELGLRCRILGWRAIYVPEARVLHHRGATLGQLNPQRVMLIERNRLLLAVKLFPGALLWLNGLFFLARVTGTALAALLNRGELSRFTTPKAKATLLVAFLKGQIQAFRLFPKMWRKRRAILARRVLSPPETRRLLMRYRISLKEISARTVENR